MLVVHEAGHFLSAFAFKLKPYLTLDGFKVKTKYATPDTDTKQRIISQAGFTLELLLGLILASAVSTGLLGSQTSGYLINHSISMIYSFLMMLHIGLHPWTSRYDDANDFNGMKSIKRGETK